MSDLKIADGRDLKIADGDPNTILISRTANGWVVQAAYPERMWNGVAEHAMVAETPEALNRIVGLWATKQQSRASSRS